MLGPQGLSNACEFRWMKVESVGTDIEYIIIYYQKRKDQHISNEHMMLGFLACSMLGLWFYDTQEMETLKSGRFRKKRRACTVWTQQLKNTCHMFIHLYMFHHFSTSIPKRLHRYPMKKHRRCNEKEDTSAVFPFRNDSGQRVSGPAMTGLLRWSRRHCCGCWRWWRSSCLLGDLWDARDSSGMTLESNF